MILHSLVQQVGHTQLKRHLALLVGFGGLHEHARRLLLRLGQDDARVAFALGLRRLRHGALQVVGQHDVADLHGDDADAPIGHLPIEPFLDLVVDLEALYRHIGQADASDGVTQSRLRRPRHGAGIVGNLRVRLLGIPHHPEHHRVHVYRGEVGRERPLVQKRGCVDTLVDMEGDLLDDGNGEVQAGLRDAGEIAEPQDNRPLPYEGDMHGIRRKCTEHQREGDGPGTEGEHACAAEQQRHHGENSQVEYEGTPALEPCGLLAGGSLLLFELVFPLDDGFEILGSGHYPTSCMLSCTSSTAFALILPSDLRRPTRRIASSSPVMPFAVAFSISS